MIVTIRLLLLMITSTLLFPLNISFDKNLPPREVEKRDPLMEVSRYSLLYHGAPDDQIETLSRAVANACRVANRHISPELIVSLIYTESGFRKDAVSPKGYMGLMQTPWASTKWPDIDIMLGVRILEEKLRIAKNNLPLALALYKGGDNPLAHRYAAETLRIYQDLLTAVEKNRTLTASQSKPDTGAGISDIFTSFAGIKVQLVLVHALVILIIGAALGYRGAKWRDKFRGARWKNAEGRMRREMTPLI
ncbi:MAG: hypothetical protein A3J94_06480 [Syntrophus sp. RIFOXYC2_FULL_54_9]|nr:MAG: hypothetical protein A2X92_07520 [Syntrophus sp. GWC2_56_31]OHE30667.1 MAG: hypothetical protein A3J94_06480 [Syntrophus sp. RIFOXYC2_FULL_54_9]HBB16489.1 hypothetical protein [Syntrophus sp. (in: bacteria)]